MKIISAFLVGGTICFIWNILDSLFKGKVPVPKLLALGMLVGAVLAALGIMDKLTRIAEAGIMVMIPVAGEAVYSIASSLLKGAPLSIALGFTLLIISLYVVPFLFSIARFTKEKASQEKTNVND